MGLDGSGLTNVSGEVWRGCCSNTDGRSKEVQRAQAHRGKLHDAVFLDVQAGGLQVKGHERPRQLQPACGGMRCSRTMILDA